MMRYEHRRQAPLSPKQFLVRLAAHGGAASGLVAASVALGTAGYYWLGHFSWLDSFLNACMLLGGMGPVGALRTPAAKIFAALFALYSGLVFLVCLAILITPVLHRVLHKFHWESDHAEP